MATATKLVSIRPAIEPALREFIDEVLVPILVQDALREVSRENHLASEVAGVANSDPTARSASEEKA